MDKETYFRIRETFFLEGLSVAKISAKMERSPNAIKKATRSIKSN